MSSINHNPVCWLVSANADKTSQVSSEAGVYSEPIEKRRGSLREGTKFVGLYSDKAIYFIGKLQKIVEGYPSEGEDKERIDNYISICRDGKVTFKTLKSKNRENGLQYYLVDEFHPTEFLKKKGWQQGTKTYINLKDHLPDPCGKSAADLAKRLRGKKW